MKSLSILFVITLIAASTYSQSVGINDDGSIPNSSAILDVKAIDKGFLPPRVALTSTTSNAPLIAHVAGMIVYNTATANDVVPGLYINNGTIWMPLKSSVNEINDLSDARTTTMSVFLGSNAGAVDDGTYNFNVGVGGEALNHNTSGWSNTSIGHESMALNTTGYSNTAVGYVALVNNLDGYGNIAVGNNALFLNQTGDLNTAIGFESMKNNTGNSNTAAGYRSLFSNTYGYWNTAFGYSSLYSNTSGNSNVAVGQDAGFNNNGSSNTLIGYGAGAGVSPTTYSGNIFLGKDAGRNENGSNKLYIENSSSASPLIYGEFDANLLRVNGTLDINNAYQLPVADGSANQILKTDGFGSTSWVTPDTEAATSDNTAGTIVKRDVSGNFAAGTITANITGNVSGTAANVTGTVALANGGTGATTATSAFDALSPMTTAGDIIYGGSSGTATRLADGSAEQVLTTNGSGTLSWQTPSSGGIPYTGATGDVDLGTHKLTSGGLLPKTNLAYNLGNTSYYWNEAYIATYLRTQSGFSIKQTSGYSVFSYGNTSTAITSPGGQSNISLNDDGTSYVKGNFVPLDLVGDYYLGSSANKWMAVYSYNGTIQTSDKRLKKDIIDLPTELIKAISELRPVEFRWKENDNGKHIGFIAQEVEQVFSDSGLNPGDYFVIQHDDETDFYSLAYSEFVSAILAYAQGIEKRTKLLEQNSKELENRLSALEKTITEQQFAKSK